MKHYTPTRALFNHHSQSQLDIIEERINAFVIHLEKYGTKVSKVRDASIDYNFRMDGHALSYYTLNSQGLIIGHFTKMLDDAGNMKSDATIVFKHMYAENQGMYNLLAYTNTSMFITTAHLLADGTSVVNVFLPEQETPFYLLEGIQSRSNANHVEVENV